MGQKPQVFFSDFGWDSGTKVIMQLYINHCIQLQTLYVPCSEYIFKYHVLMLQQLHSSVRTTSLETSLRLLSLGADPNYYYAVGHLSISCSIIVLFTMVK